MPHRARLPLQRPLNCRLARRLSPLSRADDAAAKLEEVAILSSPASAKALPAVCRLIGPLFAAISLDSAFFGAGYFSRTWGRCLPAGIRRTSSQGRGPVPRGARHVRHLVRAGEPRRCDRHSPAHRPARAPLGTPGDRFVPPTSVGSPSRLQCAVERLRRSASPRAERPSPLRALIVRRTSVRRRRHPAPRRRTTRRLLAWSRGFPRRDPERLQ